MKVTWLNLKTTPPHSRASGGRSMLFSRAALLQSKSKARTEKRCIERPFGGRYGQSISSFWRSFEIRSADDRQAGNTLVAMMAFIAAAIIMTASATSVAIINARSSSEFGQGQEASGIADSGADLAVLKLTRDPSYTGETVTIGLGTATISVSSPTPTTRTITSTGDSGNIRRVVQVSVSITNNIVSVTSWSEVP